MTQEGTIRDWAAQVRIVNKAFAHREAELKAELAEQSLVANQALDAAATKLADIESQLAASQATLQTLRQAAHEQQVRLQDAAQAAVEAAAEAAAQAARTNTELVSRSASLEQELTRQLAAQTDEGQSLQTALSAAQARHDSAVAQAAEREQALRLAQADLAQGVAAAEERVAQLEDRCRDLTEQIAAAAERERLALLALTAAHESLAGSEAQARSREVTQLTSLQALERQAEQARAAHAQDVSAAELALRATQERHEQDLARLQAAVGEQQAQCHHVAAQREAALAQLASMQEAAQLLQTQSTARERELAAQVVQTLQQARADANERRQSANASETLHAEHVSALQGEMQALGEQARQAALALQAQLVSAHEGKAAAEREAAERERGLRDDMHKLLESALAQAEANRTAQKQETRIYLAQLAERDGLFALERKDAETRALAAAEALAGLHLRCDAAQTELAEARQQHLRLQAHAEQRQQELQSEHAQLQAAAGHELDTARAAWAVQQAAQLQQIQGLTVALAAARDEEARLQASAARELEALRTVRQSQSTELATQRQELAESLALAAQLQQQLDGLQNPAVQRRPSLFRGQRNAPQALRDAVPAPTTPPPARPDVKPVPAKPHAGERTDSRPTLAAVDQPVPPPMTTHKPSHPELQHIGQLLALHGATFVTAAYRGVLGREPDADGAAYYLSRVDTEHNKPAILFELATSAEGLARRHSLVGLDDLVASRNPVRGKLRSWLNKFSRIEQTAVRIEWALAAAGRQNEERLLLIDSKLALIAQDRQQLGAQLEGRFQALDTRLTQTLASLQQLHENLGAGLANQDRQSAEGLSGLAERLTAGQHTQDLIVERLRACEDLLITAEQRASTGPLAGAAVAAAAEEPSAPRALDSKLDASQGAQSLMQHLASQLADSAEAALLSTR